MGRGSPVTGLAWNPGDTGPDEGDECAEGCASWEGGQCDCRLDDQEFPDFAEDEP